MQNWAMYPLHVFIFIFIELRLKRLHLYWACFSSLVVVYGLMMTVGVGVFFDMKGHYSFQRLVCVGMVYFRVLLVVWGVFGKLCCAFL